MKYDNLADARQKLVGTFAYYKGRAVYVRGIDPTFDSTTGEPTDDWTVRLQHVEGTPKNFNITISDNGLQYMQFNIGYLNYPGYAVFYYRTPIKQYKQGLHRNQCVLRDYSKVLNASNYDDMGLYKHVAAMLENRYPDYQEAIKMVECGDYRKAAFHKDFAMYQDTFREDFVIEYKGVPAAFGTDVFKCVDDKKWLREAMLEMNLKVA